MGRIRAPLFETDDSGSKVIGIWHPDGTYMPLTALAGAVNSYLGIVASGTTLSDYRSGANRFAGVSTEHTAAENLTSWKLVYANLYVSTGGTTGETAGAEMSALVGIEYPIGTFTRVTWGGANSGTIAAGTVAESDAISVAIPKGAMFRVHAKLGWPTGLALLTSNFYPMAGSGQRATIGANDGDVPDYTLGGGQWANAASNGVWYNHPPVAIVQQTTKPTIALFGSSTPRGIGDVSPSVSGVHGYLARAFQPGYGVMNLAISGDSFTISQNSCTARMALLKYVSHVALSLGTNDIYLNNKTAAQVQTEYANYIAKMAGKKVWIGLYQPRNTGSWASDGSQVINATYETHRKNVNLAVRAGIAGAAGFIDGLSASETVVDPESGLWRSDQGVSTTDGTHMNTATYVRAAALIAASSIMV